MQEERWKSTVTLGPTATQAARGDGIARIHRTEARAWRGVTFVAAGRSIGKARLGKGKGKDAQNGKGKDDPGKGKSKDTQKDEGRYSEKSSAGKNA